jgi:hypothetical protein
MKDVSATVKGLNQFYRLFMTISNHLFSSTIHLTPYWRATHTSGNHGCNPSQLPKQPQPKQRPRSPTLKMATALFVETLQCILQGLSPKAEIIH